MPHSALHLAALLPAVLLASGGVPAAVAPRDPVAGATRHAEPAATAIQLGLTAGATTAINDASGPIDVREVLAKGIVISLKAERAVAVRVVSIVIRDRRAGPPCSSDDFAISPGTTRVPGDHFLPDGRCIPGDHFIPGDQFIPGDHFIPGDQFSRSSTQIAETGAVSGRRIDWSSQTVLYMAVAPADPEEASASQVRPIAFLMRGER